METLSRTLSGFYSLQGISVNFGKITNLLPLNQVGSRTTNFFNDSLTTGRHGLIIVIMVDV